MRSGSGSDQEWLDGAFARGPDLGGGAPDTYVIEQVAYHLLFVRIGVHFPIKL